MYEYVLFNFAGFTSFPNSYELATQYKMATVVNQNFFAWSQEETSVQDISQVNESFFFFFAKYYAQPMKFTWSDINC